MSGYDAFLQRSDRSVVVYRLGAASISWTLAGGFALVLGVLWGIWGGLLAGLLTWLIWYKIYLPRLFARRLRENPEPDDRIDMACIEYVQSDGARELYLEILSRPYEADAVPWPGAAPPVKRADSVDRMLDDVFGPSSPSDAIGLAPAASLPSGALEIKPAGISTRRVTFEFMKRSDRESFEKLVRERP